VEEIHDALQIAAATVTRRDRAKRPVRFANDVKASPRSAVAQIVGARRVHGKIAGILDNAFAHLSQVKGACPLENHLRDLPVAFTNMAPQPVRSVRRLLCCKGFCREPHGYRNTETNTLEKTQPWPHGTPPQSARRRQRR